MLLGSAMTMGCGKPKIERAIVHGMVRFNGKPLSSGTIRFIPTAGTTPPGAADIVDGAYRVVARGGVPVGTHKIEITAFRMPPPGTVNPEREAMKREHPYFTFPEMEEQYIPSKYNQKTELTLTIPPGSADVEHNIELTP